MLVADLEISGGYNKALNWPHKYKNVLQRGVAT